MNPQIAVIDTQVQDYQTLQTTALDAGLEVILLSGDGDGIEELAERLQGRGEIDALHILSHGASGQVFLGDDVLSSDSLEEHGEALAIVSGAMAEEGDLLLYGCNVAQGEQGESFVEELALVTGADVAASDDLTGDKGLCGNWDLEVTNGVIESSSLDVGWFNQVLGALTFTNSGNWNNTNKTYSYGGKLFYMTGSGITFDSNQYSGNVYFGDIGSSIGANVDAYVYLKGGDTFDLANVDIQTWDGNTTTQSTLTFTPSTGSAVTFVSTEDVYHNVTLNFTGITGFRVTAGSTTTDLYLLNMNGVTVAAGNTAPAFTSATSFSVGETATNDNSVLLDVQANDGDGGGNDANVTYSIVGGTGQTLFSIDSDDGEIRLNATGASTLDYDRPPATP